MPCPQCKGPSRCYSTEHRAEGTVRRRQCTSTLCGHKWKTLERPAKLVRGYVYK